MLLAFLLLASIRLGWNRTTLAGGFGLYLLVGFLIALIPGSFLAPVWEGHVWGILIWPTVILVNIGPLLGWWPDYD